MNVARLLRLLLVLLIVDHFGLLHQPQFSQSAHHLSGCLPACLVWLEKKQASRDGSTRVCAHNLNRLRLLTGGEGKEKEKDMSRQTVTAALIIMKCNNAAVRSKSRSMCAAAAARLI